MTGWTLVFPKIGRVPGGLFRREPRPGRREGWAVVAGVVRALGGWGDSGPMTRAQRCGSLRGARGGSPFGVRVVASQDPSGLEHDPVAEG